MEIVAHGLWAVAAAKGKGDLAGRRIPVAWTAWWAIFPDVLAFGPAVAVGLWWRIAGAPAAAGAHHHYHVGLPLYQMGHSLVVFAAIYGLVSLVARRPVIGMLGWLMHILIDIPTHSFSYYATRFLWPVSNFRVDGIAWWTPWFWAATYVALAAVYFALWRTGRLLRAPARKTGEPREAPV
jgi:hypothetical protein